MAGIIGKKIGMSSFFDQDGKSIPCTMIEAGPCIVTQIKNIEKDGYSAIQLGFENKNQKKLKKSEIGHVKNASCQPLNTYSEFKNNYTRTNDDGTSEQFEPNVGDIVEVDMFNEGEFVDVTSTSKGKGFQGVVKRHGFAGVGDATHGQHNRMRAPGSIGAASYPARVFKGMRMAGRMGGEKVKIKNLKVLKILKEKNVIILKGAVPGHNNTYVNITN